MNNWIEISEDNLAWNLRAIAAAAGTGTEVVAVVKANAYGHGAEVCSLALVRAGARWLGVTCATEGAQVRQALQSAGLAAEILMMCGFLPADVPLIVQHTLVPVLWMLEQTEWLRCHPGLRVHVEIDTGMGRQGVAAGPEFARLLTAIKETGLIAEGLFTHFCSSELADSKLTLEQQRRFEGAVAEAMSAGLTPLWIHAGNTSAVDNPAQDWPWLSELARTAGARAMVRTGLALYGYCLPIEGRAVPRLRPELRPVMTWKAHVLAVHCLAAGETVGYNATFTADRAMPVALLPVGYADGLRRELSGRGWVMLGGQRAPILGRISMNLIVIDVTGNADVAVGDAAIVLGEGIDAEDHARLADTIAYEILCGIHPCG